MTYLIREEEVDRYVGNLRGVILRRKGNGLRILEYLGGGEYIRAEIRGQRQEISFMS
jgi:hypothetical protein